MDNRGESGAVGREWEGRGEQWGESGVVGGGGAVGGGREGEGVGQLLRQWDTVTVWDRPKCPD